MVYGNNRGGKGWVWIEERDCRRDCLGLIIIVSGWSANLFCDELKLVSIDDSFYVPLVHYAFIQSLLSSIYPILLHSITVQTNSFRSILHSYIVYKIHSVVWQVEWNSLELLVVSGSELLSYLVQSAILVCNFFYSAFHKFWTLEVGACSKFSHFGNLDDF